MTTQYAAATLVRALVIVGTLQVPQFVRAEVVAPNQLREAANKATRLMESSMAQVNPKVPCASCHHGIMPLWTLGIARDHGVTVNENLRRQTAMKSFSVLRDVDGAIQGTQAVDENIDAAELLAFGPEIGVKPSISAALHALRLMNLQQADGHWKTMDARPPQSYSNFMVTAMAAKTVAAYLPDSQAAKSASLAKAREWLANTRPVSTEDATFRVLGLSWTGADRQQLDAAAKDLASRQNADGGWSFLPGRKPDAYATGEALFALKVTGRAETAAWNSGAAWLLKTQQADGSWHVKTHINEVAHVSPPKMETGFPYGPDQILSMYATNWSVAALSLGLPEKKQPGMDLSAVMPTAEPWIETAAFGTMEQLNSIDPNARTAKGTTALMAAAFDPGRAARLIERGADVKATAQSGQNAVSVAASYAGTSELVRRLLKMGVPAKLSPKAEFHANPLVEVAWTGDLEVARALLDAGADMNQPMMRLGIIPMTALKAAVALDAVEILREYLRRGANPNTVDEIPLLSWAALGNREQAMKVLLEAGANPELKDQYGWSPMMHAKAVDHGVSGTEQILKSAVHKLEALR